MKPCLGFKKTCQSLGQGGERALAEYTVFSRHSSSLVVPDDLARSLQQLPSPQRQPGTSTSERIQHMKMRLTHLVMFDLITFHTSEISREIRSSRNPLPIPTTSCAGVCCAQTLSCCCPCLPLRGAGGASRGTCCASAEPSCPAEPGSLLTR